MWPIVALITVIGILIYAAAKKDARLTVSINASKKISNEEIEQELEECAKPSQD